MHEELLPSVYTDMSAQPYKKTWIPIPDADDQVPVEVHCFVCVGVGIYIDMYVSTFFVSTFFCLRDVLPLTYNRLNTIHACIIESSIHTHTLTHTHTLYGKL